MITNELVVGFLTDEDLAEGRATLGEWSVTRRQFSQQVREVMDAIPAPFPTHSEVEQISEYLRKQCDACLPKLAAHVSKSWGEEHSDRFWRILLMPWVTYGLMTLYERERRLSKYFAAHKTDRLLLFGVPTARPEVRVVRDFSRQAIGGDLNGILCQWLLAENAPSQQDWPSVVEVKRSESVEDRQEAPARQGLISRLSGMINAMLPVQYIGGMGIGFRIRLSLSLMFSQKRTAASAEELPVSSNNEIGSDLVSPFLCDPLKFLIEFGPTHTPGVTCWRRTRG